jgi:hypothetical protein
MSVLGRHAAARSPGSGDPRGRCSAQSLLMVDPTSPDARATYEIRVHGEIPAALLARYPRLHVRTIATETVLHRDLTDLADLDVLLEHLQSVGLELAELRQIPLPADPEASDRSNDHA